MKPSSQARHLTSCVVLAVSLVVIVVQAAGLYRRAVAAEADRQPRVMGYQQCVDCHELSVEAWKRSAHSQRSLEIMTSNLRASRYAQRLGIDAESLLTDSSCIECHGAQKQAEHGLSRNTVSVSCESCHGPAGSSDQTMGWYGLHCGAEDLPEDMGTDLDTYLKNCGMARTDDLYLLAVRCFECHSVSNEEVVRAGHVAGTHEFELVSWFAGEVRHNFAPYSIECEDEEKNAATSNLWLDRHQGLKPTSRQRLMFVMGVMADLDVNLRNRALASEEGTFATAAAGRSAAALLRLRQIADKLNDEEFLATVDDLETVRPLLFLPPQPNHRPELLAAAERVAQAAEGFLEKYTGCDLEAVEPLIASERKGEAFQP